VEAAIGALIVRSCFPISRFQMLITPTRTAMDFESRLGSEVFRSSARAKGGSMSDERFTVHGTRTLSPSTFGQAVHLRTPVLPCIM
jgi:hypothetical protein